MKTQSEIDAIAAQLRATGVPDILNRWIGITPEQVAAMESKVASMVEATNKRGDAVPRPIGKREQQLRDQREAAATQNEAAVPKTAKRKAAAKTDAVPATVTEKKAPKTEDAGKAPRHGAKLEVIGRLLARKRGCTSKEVKEACSWPSVSMPQQAAALGVTLHKMVDAKGVMHYADHPLEAAPAA